MRKKIYCPSCERLVAWKEEKNRETVQYCCLICEKPIWLKEGQAWKYGGKKSATETKTKTK